MTILIFILCILVMSGMGYRTYGEVSSRKTYGISSRQVNYVSWPGKQVLLAYQELPKQNRPEANVPAIVKALDVTYGVVEATEHFEHKTRNYNYGGSPAYNYTYAWNNCSCSNYRSSKCSFPEYREMVQGMQDIQDAITAQQRALEVASVGGDLENAKALTERLREERDLIKKATSEL